MFESPFFHPEFALAMDWARGDVEVGVIEEDGRPVGFFPYHRVGRDCAAPLGLQLAGFEGVIASSGIQWHPEDLIRGCGLRAWRFDHLPAAQLQFEPYFTLRVESPWIDVSGGIEAYRNRLTKPAIHQWQEARRRFRRAARELPEAQFELDCRSSAAVELLIRWKDAQCRRTGVASVFELPWVRPLLFSLADRRDDVLRAMVSVLRFGERIAAVHYGLRSDGVLHSMLPAYDTEFAPYSPGLILFYELIAQSESLGLKRIDLGKGEALYKSKLATGSTAIAEGAIDLRFGRAALWRAWLLIRDRMRSSWMRKPAHRINRILSNIRNRWGRRA